MSKKSTMIVAIAAIGTMFFCSHGFALTTHRHHKSQDKQLDAYGSQTKLHIGRLHDAILIVTQQTMKLKERPALTKDKVWKRRTNAKLSEIIMSGDKLAHIHPVPKPMAKVNADLAELGRSAQHGARRYLKGEDQQDTDTMLAGFKELVNVGLTFEKLSAMRGPGN